MKILIFLFTALILASCAPAQIKYAAEHGWFPGCGDAQSKKTGC
jgi:hypothetical protein